MPAIGRERRKKDRRRSSVRTCTSAGRASEMQWPRILAIYQTQIPLHQFRHVRHFCKWVLHGSVSSASLTGWKEAAVICCSCLRPYRAARARGWGFPHSLERTQLRQRTVRLDAKSEVVIHDQIDNFGWHGPRCCNCFFASAGCQSYGARRATGRGKSRAFDKSEEEGR